MAHGVSDPVLRRTSIQLYFPRPFVSLYRANKVHPAGPRPATSARRPHANHSPNGPALPKTHFSPICFAAYFLIKTHYFSKLFLPSSWKPKVPQSMVCTSRNSILHLPKKASFYPLFGHQKSTQGLKKDHFSPTTFFLLLRKPVN